MTKADSQTTDTSRYGVRIAHLITGRIFAAASLSAPTDAPTGAVDGYTLYPPLLDTARHSPKSRVVIKL
jgi:hypothetical protein